MIICRTMGRILRIFGFVLTAFGCFSQYPMINKMALFQFKREYEISLHCISSVAFERAGSAEITKRSYALKKGPDIAEMR